MVITVTKARLLELLGEALERSKTEDAKMKASHEKDERAALLKFREQIRSALKWEYTFAKSQGFRVGNVSRPSCPRSETSVIESVIKGVKTDMRKSPYQIRSGSDIEIAMNWQPERLRPKKSICD